MAKSGKTIKAQAQGNNLPAAFPKPNFVELAGTGAEFPEGIKEAAGTVADVPYEWEPIKTHECVKGYVRRINHMSLGGVAYVLDICPSYADHAASGVHLLLTKGGKVLQSRMEALQVQVGDLVAILYLGLGEAKEGLNAPRLWQVKKLKL